MPDDSSEALSRDRDLTHWPNGVPAWLREERASQGLLTPWVDAESGAIVDDSGIGLTPAWVAPEPITSDEVWKRLGVPAGARTLGVRRTLLILVAFCAVLVATLGRPEVPVEFETPALVEEALSDHAANNVRAEGAPQQQVVNGWVARDLLTIIALRDDRQARDERPVYLLLLGVLAITVIGSTSPARQPE